MSRIIIPTAPLNIGSLPQLLAGSNTIIDPSFETDVSHWSTFQSSISSDNTIARTGSKSLKMVTSTSIGSTFYTETGITAGAQKVFKAWVRGDATSAGKFVQLKIKSEVDQTFQDTYPMMLTQGYQEIWCVWKIPNTGSVTYTIQGYDTVNGNNVWIDDVTIDTYTCPTVSVSGKFIKYNGVNTFLRGMNYNNVGTSGSYVNWGTEAKMLGYDIPELAAMGCNSIRIYYDTYNRNDYGRGFNICYQLGIGVRVLYYPWLPAGDFTQAIGSVNRNALIGYYTAMVTTLKDIPAVIGYGMGSEANFNLGSNSATDWFTLLDACCVAGKAIDNTRIFYTSNGEVNSLSENALVPNLDVWGYTVYRGGSIAGIDTQIQGVTKKPVIISEIGNITYDATMANGNQDKKTDEDINIFRQCENAYPIITGYDPFQWMDDRGDTSWYGYGEAVSGGYAASRAKRKTYTALKNYWQRNNVPNI